METNRCKAKTFFIQHVEGYGMVHGNPDSKDAATVNVPAHLVRKFAGSDFIYLPGDLPQLDHDADGEPGGSVPYDPPALTGKNKAQLLEIAAAEGVIIPDDAKNADIIALIEAVRAGENVAVTVGDHDADGEPGGEGAAPVD